MTQLELPYDDEFWESLTIPVSEQEREDYLLDLPHTD